MLDWRIRQVEADVRPAPRPWPAQRIFEVSLRWDDDLTELHRRAKPAAALEQFTMIRARPSESDPSVWICAFAHVGRSIDMDRQTVSLLRRLTPVAPWVKAERHDVQAAPQEAADERLWNDCYRRALP